MLLFRHYIAKSVIHGLGVFATEFIPRGTLVWVFNSVVDIKVPKNSLLGLPKHVIDRVQAHAEYFPADQCFILGTDGDYYMNHADMPNLLRGAEKNMFAASDILIGEELTCDYRTVKVLAFDPDRQEEHNRSRCPENLNVTQMDDLSARAAESVDPLVMYCDQYHRQQHTPDASPNLPLIGMLRCAS